MGSNQGNQQERQQAAIFSFFCAKAACLRCRPAAAAYFK
jgi:hypothetical protein